MQRKKILLVAPVLTIGGAEKVVRDIAWYADPQQYEMHLLILKDAVGIYETQLLERGCKSFHVAEPSESYWNYMASLLKLMKRERYHAVHVHTMFSCGWVMLAAKIAGVPVRIAHAHSALRDGGGFVKGVYEMLMRCLILTCATDLVACGVAAGQRLFGHRAYEKRGRLVLNGIDVAAFAYNEDARAALRRQYGWEDRFVIGHTGHLAQVKNQSFLLELMPRLLERRPDALLVLLGEGEDRPMLQEKIRQLRLEKAVYMPGNVTNVADHLSAMDVYAFPSLYEGLPLAILEVQANGLPCVISDSVPRDVFLTPLLRPLSLSAPKDVWVDAILSARRDSGYTDRTLRDSAYAVETAMGKIYRIYNKGNSNDENSVFY